MKGNHRSKPAELILREVGQLVEQGVREVVLVGQDTTRYGHDLGQRDGLADAARADHRRCTRTCPGSGSCTPIRGTSPSAFCA